MTGDDTYAFVADLYDHVGPYRSRLDVAFFLDEAVGAGGPVLELGCGTGRVLIPIARAGVEIVGVDASAPMLNICRDRLLQELEAVQARVTLVHADMRSFALDRRFTLATIPFRPFQHLLTVDDQLACLSAIRRHLVDGGRLILDLFNPSLDALVNDVVGQEHGEEPEFSMPDGRRGRRRQKTAANNRCTQLNDSERT